MDLRTIGEAMAEAFAAEDPVRPSRFICIFFFFLNLIIIIIIQVDVRIGYPNNQGAQVIDRQYRFG